MAEITEALPSHIVNVEREETQWQSLIFRRGNRQTILFGRIEANGSQAVVYFQKKLDRIPADEELRDWQALFKGLSTEIISRQAALEARRDDPAWSRRQTIGQYLARLWIKGFFGSEINDSRPIVGGAYVSEHDSHDSYKRLIVEPDGAIHVTIEDPTYSSAQVGKISEHTYILPRQVPYVLHTGISEAGEKFEGIIFADTAVAASVLQHIKSVDSTYQA